MNIVAASRQGLQRLEKVHGDGILPSPETFSVLFRWNVNCLFAAGANADDAVNVLSLKCPDMFEFVQEQLRGIIESSDSAIKKRTLRVSRADLHRSKVCRGGGCGASRFPDLHLRVHIILRAVIRSEEMGCVCRKLEYSCHEPGTTSICALAVFVLGSIHSASRTTLYHKSVFIPSMFLDYFTDCPLQFVRIEGVPMAGSQSCFGETGRIEYGFGELAVDLNGFVDGQPKPSQQDGDEPNLSVIYNIRARAVAHIPASTRTAN